MDKPPTAPQADAETDMYLRNRTRRLDPKGVIPALRAALNQQALAIANAIECGFIDDAVIGRLRSAMAFNDIHIVNSPDASASDATTSTTENPAE